MSTQYKRKVSLVVSDNNLTGVELGQMRLKFSVNQADIQTPSSCFIRVYNLAAGTADLIEREFTKVVLMAGYEDTNFGVVFEGQVKFYRRGRENQTDTYLDILAADGDAAYNFGVISASLSAGSTPADQVAVLGQSLEEHGVTPGYVDGLTDTALPRGKVLFGMTRDYLRDVAASNNVSWTIQDGQLTMIPLRAAAPGDAVVLSSKTGLIGFPEQTPDGIRIKSLLNPNLRMGRLVQVDNASVQRALISVAYSAINLLPSVADDGLYKVLVVNHSGDTRGNEWYSDMTCLALRGSIFPTSLLNKLVGGE